MSKFKESDWEREVANGDTQLDYPQWVEHQLEMRFRQWVDYQIEMGYRQWLQYQREIGEKS